MVSFLHTLWGRKLVTLVTRGIPYYSKSMIQLRTKEVNLDDPMGN